MIVLGKNRSNLMTDEVVPWGQTNAVGVVQLVARAERCHDFRKAAVRVRIHHQICVIASRFLRLELLDLLS